MAGASTSAGGTTGTSVFGSQPREDHPHPYRRGARGRRADLPPRRGHAQRGPVRRPPPDHRRAGRERRRDRRLARLRAARVARGRRLQAARRDELDGAGLARRTARRSSRTSSGRLLAHPWAVQRLSFISMRRDSGTAAAPPLTTTWRRPLSKAALMSSSSTPSGRVMVRRKIP